MGRPLNKRFYNPSNQDLVGGEGVDSITVTAAGTYTTKPTASIDGPSLPTGVAATLGSVHMKALSATVSVGGTGGSNQSYQVGDLLTVSAAVGTKAVFPVATTALRTLGAVSSGNGQYLTNDQVTFSGAGITTPIVASLIVTAGVINGFSIVNAGVVNAVIDVTAVAATSYNPVGGGTGTGATFDLGMKVLTVGSPSVAGDMTSIPANAAATTTNSATGTGATLTVSYGVLSIDVATSGSGYINAADAAVSFGSGAATAVANLTTTSRNVILAHARVVGSASVLNADIEKQTGANEYVMTTTDGTSRCSLVTNTTPPPGGAYILAYDSNGSSYYVTKITAHKVKLVRKTAVGSFVFRSGVNIHWSFDAATDYIVRLESA